MLGAGTQGLVHGGERARTPRTYRRPRRLWPPGEPAGREPGAGGGFGSRYLGGGRAEDRSLAVLHRAPRLLSLPWRRRARGPGRGSARRRRDPDLQGRRHPGNPVPRSLAPCQEGLSSSPSPSARSRRSPAAADLLLRIRIEREADTFNMLATTSTMAVIAVFDAACIVLMEVTGFTREQFAVIHPSGAVGQRLLSGRSDRCG